MQKGFAIPFDEMSPLELNKTFSLSEKTRRAAVKKIPNGDRRCVGLSFEKSSIFQALLFFCVHLSHCFSIY